MIRRWTVVAWLTGILLFTASSAVAGPTASGTYDVLVCKGPCSFEVSTNVVAKGVLVLANASFAPKSLNQRSVLPFERAYGIGGDPNGCFVLDTVQENRSYAGLIEVGMTLWRTGLGRVQLELYTSPDAGYFATLTLTSDGFRGEGGSSGGGPAETVPGPDILIGKRIGPGDVDACVRAAAERQRKLGRAA